MSRPSDLMSQPLCPVHHTARPESCDLTSPRILRAGIGSLGHSWPEGIARNENTITVVAIAPACLNAGLRSLTTPGPGDPQRLDEVADPTADGRNARGVEVFDSRPSDDCYAPWRGPQRVHGPATSPGRP